MNQLSFRAILLAAGNGTRYQVETNEKTNKLLANLSTGANVAVSTARKLVSILPVTAIVQHEGVLSTALQEEGCEVIYIGSNANLGMSESLKQGIAHCSNCDGWIIALADMPFIRPDTIYKIRSSLEKSSSIVRPRYKGASGHPVGIPYRYYSDIMKLQGDVGARDLIKRYGAVEIDVDDPGIVQDIDVPSDLLYQEDLDG